MRKNTYIYIYIYVCSFIYMLLLRNSQMFCNWWSTVLWNPWRRKWQPTPMFLPGESHGQRSPAGYSPCGLHRVGHNWSDKAAAVKWQPGKMQIWSRDDHSTDYAGKVIYSYTRITSEEKNKSNDPQQLLQFSSGFNWMFIFISSTKANCKYLPRNLKHLTKKWDGVVHSHL